MVRRIALLLTSGLALAGAANAAPWPRATDITLTLEIPEGFHAPPFPGITSTVTGASVTVDTVAGTLSLAAGAVMQTAPITLPVTVATAIASLRFSGIANLAGTFRLGGGAVTSPTTELPCGTPIPAGIGCVTGGAGNLGGRMPLAGTIYVVVAPMILTIPIPLLDAGLGMGGFRRVPDTVNGFLYDAAPWTQGRGKIGLLATSTFATIRFYHRATSVSTPWNTVSTNTWSTSLTRTGGGGTVASPHSGVIALVSPTFLNALGSQVPIFARMEIHFAPEPGTLWLLCAGLGGLVLLRQRR